MTDVLLQNFLCNSLTLNELHLLFSAYLVITALTYNLGLIYIIPIMVSTRVPIIINTKNH